MVAEFLLLTVFCFKLKASLVSILAELITPSLLSLPSWGERNPSAYSSFYPRRQFFFLFTLSSFSFSLQCGFCLEGRKSLGRTADFPKLEISLSMISGCKQLCGSKYSIKSLLLLYLKKDFCIWNGVRHLRQITLVPYIYPEACHSMGAH